MTRLVGTMVLWVFAGATWAAGLPDTATWERFGEIEEASQLNRRGVALYQAGKLVEVTTVLTSTVVVSRSDG